MENPIVCPKCKKTIQPKEIAIMPYWHTIKPYHNKCSDDHTLIWLFEYFTGRRLRELKINSIKWTQISIILGAVGLLALVLFVKALIIEPPINPKSLFAYLYIALVFLLIFLFFYPLIVRIYSYLKFERPLKK